VVSWPSGCHAHRGHDGQRPAVPAGGSAPPATPTVSSLTTDHSTDPLGIDDSHPQLGWVITSAARGVSQSQYEIRVAHDENGLASGRDLVWDSGTVHSAQSFDVSYAGPALASQTRYYWQVRVRDNDGRLSPWSQPAWFETAFLVPSQFQGSWITSPKSAGGNVMKNKLRDHITLAGSRVITRARLYVAGLSYCPYLYVNGHSVTDDVLNTDFTTYDKTVDYSTYDVTRLVRPGSDALAGEPWQWLHQRRRRRLPGQRRVLAARRAHAGSNSTCGTPTAPRRRW
jgi:alpha-L-rhamnosidase